MCGEARLANRVDDLGEAVEAEVGPPDLTHQESWGCDHLENAVVSSFSEVHNGVCDVVDQQNQGPSSDDIASDIGETQEDSDDVMKKHLFKVFSSFHEEYMIHESLQFTAKVNQTIGQQSLIDFSKRHVYKAILKISWSTKVNWEPVLIYA